MSHLLRNLLFALIATVVVGVLYKTFFMGGSTDLTAISSEKHDVVLQTEKILADIQKINTYTIDDSVFDDARFTSLQSYRVPITDVGTGRSNPFAPVQ
ncbi:MAG TPA: hypothetical protein VFS75_01155 [Candidatus Paceibacterota bacterium]|nr:hypothetical protein [Candidatus Paceibacterota bacterium]